LERRVFTFPRRKPSAEQWVRLPDVALRLVAESRAKPAIFERREYFPFLPAGSSAAREVELLFPRRGRYFQDEFGVSTRFPFSFLIKTRRLAFPFSERPAGSEGQDRSKDAGSRGRELVVYPSVEPTDELFEVLPMITGELETFVRGRGDDLYSIREYLPGDPARHVDWNATARTGALKVREFTSEDERKLRIVFDNPGEGAVSEIAYERGIRLAASLAWHFAGEHAELTFVAPGSSRSTSVYDFLHYLGLVQPGPAQHSDNSLLEDLPLTGDYNLVFTSRPRGSIPTALWASSYFLFFQEPA
jgi:uncharacterized protein (DUF58 family)